MDRGCGRRMLPAVGLLVVTFLFAGCTGRPSSTSAWQRSTDQTLGTVISGLGTARIVVREEAQTDLPHTYAVVAVTDAIDTSTKEVSSYLVGQPPDQLHQAQAAVTRALQDGIAVLVDVRVALASPGFSGAEAAELIHTIDAMRDRLDGLDGKVMKAPRTVTAP